MSKITAPLPTFARAGVTPGWDKLEVVDAKSGKPIDRVIEADAEQGRIVRTSVDENGNLERDGDAVKLTEEQHAIRFRWREDPEQPTPVLDEGAAGSAGDANG